MPRVEHMGLTDAWDGTFDGKINWRRKAGGWLSALLSPCMQMDGMAHLLARCGPTPFCRVAILSFFLPFLALAPRVRASVSQINISSHGLRLAEILPRLGSLPPPWPTALPFSPLALLGSALTLSPQPSALGLPSLGPRQRTRCTLDLPPYAAKRLHPSLVHACIEPDAPVKLPFFSP